MLHCKNSMVALTMVLLLVMCNAILNKPAICYYYTHVTKHSSWYQSSIHCSIPRRKHVMSVADGAFISQITHLSCKSSTNQLSKQLYCLCSVSLVVSIQGMFVMLRM